MQEMNIFGGDDNVDYSKRALDYVRREVMLAPHTEEAKFDVGSRALDEAVRPFMTMEVMGDLLIRYFHTMIDFVNEPNVRKRLRSYFDEKYGCQLERMILGA